MPAIAVAPATDRRPGDDDADDALADGDLSIPSFFLDDITPASSSYSTTTTTTTASTSTSTETTKSSPSSSSSSSSPDATPDTPAPDAIATIRSLALSHAKRWDTAVKTISAKEGVPASDILWLPSPSTPSSDPVPDTAVLCCMNVGSASVPGDVQVVEEWASATEGFVALKVGKGKPYSFLQYATPSQALKAILDLAGRPMPQPFRATTRVLLLTPARFLPFPETDVLTDPAEIFKAVPGLYVFPEFISVAEEEELLRKVQEHLWIELSVRQVQHHGFAFDYDINKVASLTQPPLPPWSLPVLDRLYAHPSRPPGTPTYNQLTVNQYPAGTGIPPHTDTHSGFRDNVLIVSLAHPVVMEFRTLYDPRAVPAPPHRRDPAAADPFRTVNVLLDRRSAVVLHGEARFGWEHGIRARAADVVAGRLVERKMRTSLTFREVRLWEGDEEEAEVVVVVGGAKAGPAKRKPRCDCAFPWICDARLVGGALPDRLRPAGETVNRHGVARKM